MTNPELIRKQAERWLKKKESGQTSKDNSESFANLEIVLKQEEERYSLAYGQGIMPLEVYESCMAEIIEKKKALELQKAESQTPRNHTTQNLPSIDMLVKLALETIKSFNFSDKKLILKKLIEKVIATKEKVVISGFIPINLVSRMELCHGDWNCWPAKCR